MVKERNGQKVITMDILKKLFILIAIALVVSLTMVDCGKKEDKAENIKPPVLKPEEKSAVAPPAEKAEAEAATKADTPTKKADADRLAAENAEADRLAAEKAELNNLAAEKKAAEAAECARNQGDYWSMHNKIFENQEALSVNNLKQWASDIGLDSAEFNNCLDSSKFAEEVNADFSQGQSYGVTGTPAFFINGIKLVGAQPLSAFKKIIDQREQE